MSRKFVASSSPHLRDDISTARIMQDVCIALAPAGIMSVIFFGLRAAMLILLAVASAVASEALYQKHTRRPIRVGDWSAVVTGLLVAYNVPASAPWWIPVIGSAVAILLIKQIFGGIGQNFMNPAMGARAILMVSWASIMTCTVAPQPGNLLQGFGAQVDAVSQATPLASNWGAASYSLGSLLIGNVPGMLGETSKIALLLGGGYLLYRKVISWHIPATFLGTMFVLYLIYTGSIYTPGTNQSALFQLCSGGLILGAFFMATDYVTSPVTPLGKIIMGVGCGVICFAIRALNPAYPEGCSFAILMMNLFTPLIDRVIKPRSFGEVKTHA